MIPKQLKYVKLKIPTSWILLAVFIVSVMGAGAWVFTTPPDGKTNQTGSYFGNTSNDAYNYSADNFFATSSVLGKQIGGIIYADQYETLQDAINATSSSMNVVDIPCGTYAPINITRSSLTLQGHGICTIIQGTGATPIIRTDDPMVRYYRINIRDLYVLNTVDKGAGVGIDFNNVSLSSISDVELRGGNIGIFISGEAYYNDFYSLNINNQITGIKINNSGNENNFYSPRFNVVTTAFDLDTVDDIKIFSPSIENANNGFNYTNALAISVYSPRLEGVGAGFNINPSSNYNFVFNPYMATITTKYNDTSYNTTIFQSQLGGTNLQIADSGANFHSLVNLSRNAPGGSLALLNISDNYAASGSPTEIMIWKARNAGDYVQFFQGSTLKFNISVSGGIHTTNGTGTAGYVCADTSGAFYIKTTCP